MDQQKIGETLKQLRKQKGLTQSELAEKFNTTNRSVSRWETGSNLPDISVLIEIAEFYDVELKDILAGNLVKDKMDETVKETAMLVAEYSNEDKKRMKQIFHYLFLLSAALNIACVVVRELELTGAVWDFFSGFGQGVGLGCLIIGIFYTGDYFEKFMNSKKDKTALKKAKGLIIGSIVLEALFVVGLIYGVNVYLCLIPFSLGAFCLVAGLIYKG